jgi:hypothetical protein
MITGIDSLQESIPTVRKLLSDTARAHVDEKYIPVSKMDVSWAVGDSIPHTWFIIGSYFLLGS